LASVWAIEVPEPELAPQIEPVLVPRVHAKLLDALAANEMAVVAPLQILAVFAVVTAGRGLTVTVIVVLAPTHEPAVEVGTTT
jgi:hypothetical protein